MGLHLGLGLDWAKGWAGAWSGTTVGIGDGTSNNKPTLVFMSGSATVAPVYEFKSLYSLLYDEYRIVVVEKAGYGYSEIYEVERDINTPSGHAMNNAALYTMLVLLIIRYIQTRFVKIILIMACIALPMLIGFSRVYLGVHYAGDILGGWMLGLALSMFVYYIWVQRLE